MNQYSNAIAEYFLRAPLRHKISDLALLLLTMTLGLFLYLNLTREAEVPHTVEASFAISREIQETITQQQSRNNWLFLGYYRMHNGTTSLSRFNFMRSSLGEHASVDNINFSDHQNIPIAAQIPLVAKLVNNQCLTESVNSEHILYYAYQFTQITSLTSCPVRHRGQLTGYVTVGHSTPVSAEELSNIVMRIQTWQ